MSLTVRPLSDALGAEVGGSDLSLEMDRDTFSKAWKKPIIRRRTSSCTHPGPSEK
ncbi:hypothetical protein MYX82_04125 [Acidobacteria bacterium AH-259-D05]|nr:hypothetical protein [Acidobacteria bacterium AH-259-D05]